MYSIHPRFCIIRPKDTKLLRHLVIDLSIWRTLTFCTSVLENQGPAV